VLPEPEAEPEPEESPPDDEVPEFPEDALLEDPAASPVLAAPEPEPPRKSVTYQPEPLSWKPAAVTCLEKASAWQAGQVVNTGSEIFCSTSFAWPQAVQR
jgi:hypothetical protein